MTPVFDQGFELDRVNSVKMEEADRPSVLGGNMTRILEDGAKAGT
jgi:hypothetical protein